jgi:hypothetical protein
MVLAHLLFAWGWIATQSRRLVARQSARERINYLLNLSLFAVVTAAIFSGIVISQTAIPALTGTTAAPEMDWRWDVLHNRFSEAVVLLSAFHLAINWQWVLAAGQRLLFRIVLLSLAAAAFAGLTAVYGDAAPPPLPNPYWQAARRHRALAPQVDKFPEFVAEGMVVTVYAVAGRLILRLRLSRVPHTLGKPIELNLD